MRRLDAGCANGAIASSLRLKTCIPGVSVKIEGTAEFVRQASAALDRIRATKAGRTLLAGLDRTGFETTIAETRKANGADPDQGGEGWGDVEHPSRGCATRILYNPSIEVIGDGSEPWMHRPPFVALFHELIHAYDSAHGIMRHHGREPTAVGLPYDDDGRPLPKYPRPTENDLRRELGLPVRTFYNQSHRDRAAAKAAMRAR